MARQLVFTSAPQGLTPGRTGFSTVARHGDLRERLVPLLEGLSVYPPGWQPPPVICAFRLLDLGGTRIPVLSRVIDAGQDYTHRTNFLAHHLILDPDEIAAAPTPADIFLRWPGWLNRWASAPRWLAEADFVNLAALPPAASPALPAQTWGRLAGDPGRAALLIDGNQAATRVLRCAPGAEDDLLALFRESAALLDPGQAWRAEFTTCIQIADTGTAFRWAGLRAGSTADTASSRPGHVLDLTQPDTLPPAPINTAGRQPANPLGPAIREAPRRPAVPPPKPTLQKSFTPPLPTASAKSPTSHVGLAVFLIALLALGLGVLAWIRWRQNPALAATATPPASVKTPMVGLSRSSPSSLPLNLRVTAVAAGGAHCLFLENDGSLGAMGWNAYGQLGDGTTTDRFTPERIIAGGVTAIAAGSSFSLFRKTDGSLWAMGANGNGQLGDGTTTAHLTPIQILPSGVTGIAAGGNHSLFLKTDGSLWAMGANDHGQLGDGAKKDNPALSNLAEYRQRDVGTALDHSIPEQIVPDSVIAVSADRNHALFLKTDGSLWAMGWDNQGQLGDTPRRDLYVPGQIVPANVTAIAAGDNFSLFLKDDGSLWGMGWDSTGALDSARLTHIKPTRLPMNGVSAIAANSGFSLRLKTDGSLWGAGWLAYGTGDKTNAYPGQFGLGFPAQIIAGLPNTAQGRLSAAQQSLQPSLAILATAAIRNHGGFVENATAQVNQALADITAATSYLDTHPNANILLAGPAASANPVVPPASIPDFDRTTFGGDKSPNMVIPLTDFNVALRQFARPDSASTDPIPGDLGGYRDKIIQDLTQASAQIIAGMDYSRRHPARSIPAARAAPAISPDSSTPTQSDK